MGQTFREFLDQKVSESPAVERRSRCADWVRAVEALLNQIESWLHSEDPDSRLEFEHPRVMRLERGLGEYEVGSLTVRLGDSAIHIVPVARNIMGLVVPQGTTVTALHPQGRVDISCGVWKYNLFRVLDEGEERWYARDEKLDDRLLTPELLLGIVRDLLS